MINLLVTYDVNTLSREGRRRLRRVAKVCEGYGQRVQLSVFECAVNDVQREVLRQRLKKAIEPSLDSLRIYTLYGARGNAVEACVRDSYGDFTDPLVIRRSWTVRLRAPCHSWAFPKSPAPVPALDRGSHCGSRAPSLLVLAPLDRSRHRSVPARSEILTPWLPCGQAATSAQG